MKRPWISLWVLLVLTLVAVELGIVSGLIVVDPITNFYVLLVAIVVIGVLAMVGAMFLGIFLTHRIFTRGEFTPFEREMLGMREDIKRLAARVDELVTRTSGGREDRP